MSEVFDEKVVAMKFDNKDFEKNAAQSMSTLQKLKASLNFKDSAKSLNEITQASKKVDFSNITNGISEAIKNFNLMDMVGIKVLSRIADKVIDTGKNIAKSLTIDPVKTGMGVYEQKINSVQTILNNSGKDLKSVNKILDDLNEYSDKTIFSLNDMTTALGKFTAQGVDAEKAMTIIKGAANEAATMGAGSTEFSRFIYNLTQAYGMGKMTTIDWRSLENAGVAGKKFKEQLLESAKAMGTLDDAYRIVNGAHKGMQVTLANMREYLQDGIITADVMTDTFMKYADETTNFGQAAYAAAKEIKTFHQLLDVLGESVASTWSQSFSYIVGDFYEAKALWTNISILFENTFGKINERRNELLKEWKEGFVDWSNVPSEVMKAIGSADEAFNSSEFFNENKLSGRTMLLDAFCNVLLAIRQIVLPIKEAFREFFPAATAKNLWEATKNLRDFTAHLKLSEQSIKDIKSIARGVFAVLKTGRDIIKDILGAIIPATKNTNSLLAVVLRLAGALGEFVARIVPAIRESETWRIILAGIGNVLGFVIRAITLLVLIIARLIKAAHDFGLVQKVFQAVVGAVGLLIHGIKNIIPATKQAFDYIRNYSGGVIGFIMDGVYKIGNFVSGLFSKNKTKNAAKNVDNIAKSVDGLSKSVEDVPIAEVASNSAAGLGALKDKIDEIKRDKYGNPIFSDDYKMSHTISMDEQNEGNPANKLDETAKSAQKSGTLIQRFGRALINIVKGIGSGIVKVVNIVRDSLFGVGENVGIVTKGVRTAEERLGDNTKGLANKIGGFFNGLLTGLRKVNWGAVIVGGLLTALLVIVGKVASTLLNLGKGFKNATAAAKGISSAFNNMTATIKAKHNVVANVLKSIALGILAIAASLWLLSTLQDDGKLASALGALVAALVIVIGLFTLAGVLVKKAGIAGPLKQLSLAILAASAFMLAMSISFGSIIETLKGIEGSWALVGQAAAVIVGIAGVMLGLSFVLSKFNTADSFKTILSILVWTVAIKSLVKAIKGLYKDARGLKPEEVGSIWAAGVFPVIVLLGALVAAALAIKGKGGIGSFIFLMGLVWAAGKVVEAIKDISLSGAVDRLEEHKVLFLGLLAFVSIMTLILSKWGSGFMKFASGILMIGATIAAIAGLAVILRNSGITMKDLAIPAIIAAFVTGIAFIMAKIFSKNKILSVNLASFALVIAALAATILSLGVAMRLITETITKENGDNVVAVATILVVGIGAIIAALALVINQFGKLPQGQIIVTSGLTGIILSLSVLTLAIGGLAKTFDKVSLGSMIGAVVAVGGVISALALLARQMGHFKHAKPGSLLSFVLVLVVVFSNLIILSLYNWYDLIAPVVAINLTLGLLAVLAHNMSGLKDIDKGKIYAFTAMILVLAAGIAVLANMPLAGVLVSSAALAGSIALIALSMRLIPKDLKNVSGMIVMAAMIAIVAGALVVLTQLDMAKMLISSAALAGTMMLLGLAIRWAANDAKSVGTAIVMAAAIAVIAGSLSLLTLLVGDDPAGMLSAALAISGVAIAMSVACLILSKGSGSARDAITSAAAFAIVAGSMALLSVALMAIKDVPTDAIWSLAGVIAAIAVSIAIVSGFGDKASTIISAGAAIAIVTASMLIMGIAAKQLDKVKWSTILTAAGAIMIIAGAVALAGALKAKALLGALAIDLACIALIAMGYAVGEMEKVPNLGRIVGTIAAIIAIMTAFAALAAIPYVGQGIMIGQIGMLAMSAALFIFAHAVTEMNKVSNLGRIVGAIAAFAGVLILMGISGIVQLAGAAGVTAMGAALLVLAAAVIKLDEVGDLGSIAWGLAKLAGGLALIGAAGLVLLVGGPGLTAAGPGLIMLAEGLVKMSQIDDKLTAGRLAGLALGLAALALAGIPLLLGSAGFNLAGPGFLALAEGLAAMGTVGDKITGGWLAGIAGGLALIGLAGIPLLIGAVGLWAASGSIAQIAYGLAALGKVGDTVTGPWLSSIAEGLKDLGMAGIPLILGALGLYLTSGPISQIAYGLAELGKAKINGTTLKQIADGLTSMAMAGIAGILGGPGLMLLSIGVTWLAEALGTYVEVLAMLANVTANQVTKDAAQSGQNIIDGLAGGLSEGMPSIFSMMAMMGLGALGSFNGALGIQSPSVMFKLSGKWIVIGLANGIQTFESEAEAESAWLAEKTADSFIDTMGNRLKEMVSSMGDTFSGLTDKFLGGNKVKGHYIYDPEFYTAKGKDKAKYKHWVEEENKGILDTVKNYLFGNGDTSITEVLGLDGFDMNDLFSGMFSGLNDLSDVFKDLVNVGDGMNFELSGMDTNFDAVAGAIGNTDKKTKGLNKSMKESINNTKDLNTALQRTNKELDQSIVGKKASYDEFQNMMVTLTNTNYDDAVLKDIVDQYESNGLTDELYQTVKSLYARALYGGEQAIEEYNANVKGLTNAETGTSYMMGYLKKQLNEGSREAKYAAENFKATYGALTNELYSEAYAEDGAFENFAAGIFGTSSAFADAAVKERLAANGMDSWNKKVEKRNKIQKDLEDKANKGAADRMIQDFTDAVKNALNKYFLPERFQEIGENLCLGLVAGISNKKKYTLEKTEAFARAVVETMQNGFKEHSPSRLTMQMGEYLDEGLAMGLSNNGEAINAADRYGTSLLDELRYQLARILQLSDEEWTPVISPVFDFTNASADMQRFNNGLSSTMTMATNSDFSYYRASQLATEMTLAGMSKAEFQQYLAAFADNVVNAINSEGPVPVEVNVNLEGDAEGIFKLVQDQNNQFKRTAGYSGLI